MKRKQEPKKYCMTCGALLTRKRYANRLEDYGAFLRRKYCSLSCANTRPEKTPDGWRWTARKSCGPACEACGSKSKLHVHHRNQDIKDNSPKNLQTLCGSCHAKHHHSIRRRGQMVHGKAVSSG